MSTQEYMDYDYLDSDEAAYQGYDVEDDSGFDYGVTIKDSGSIGSEQVNRKGQDSWNSEYDDEDDWLSGDPSDDGAGDADADEDPSDGSENWYGDENDGYDSDAPVSSESYVLDGREFRDVRQYNLALYKRDVSNYPQLDRDEQAALARSVRIAMLCECNIRLIIASQQAKRKKKRGSAGTAVLTADHEASAEAPDQSADTTDETEDQEIPVAFPRIVVVRLPKALKRLHPTKEENEWLELLTIDEKRQFIIEGLEAQEKLITHNLPLVMKIAAQEHNKMEYLDRIQAGNIGLMKAVQYFDPYKGYQFSTYATYLIRCEIRDQAGDLRRQSAGPIVRKDYVPTEADINRTCERMGGRFWMQEVSVDTGQTEDRIRKQIAFLLEQKRYIEALANEIVLGWRDEYSSWLIEAEESKTGLIQRYIRRTDDPGDGNSGEKRKRLDLITGDGLPPKKKEMSFEDFVRGFFQMVVSLRNISPENKADFILKEKDIIESKGELLRRYLNPSFPYSDYTAIKELESLIGTGSIWPERHEILQARDFGWKEHKSSDDVDTSEHLPDNQRWPDFSDYFDTKNPTESIALILSEGYVAHRRMDIQENAKIASSFFDWLNDVVYLTMEKRLEKLNVKIMKDLASGFTYRMIEAMYDIHSDNVNRRCKKILDSIYDQMVESSNRENRDALLKIFEIMCQSWLISQWKTKMINRIVRDHYVENKRFSLRSRGTADGPRPLMESFYNTVEDVTESVTTAAEMVRELRNPIIASVRELLDILSSIGGDDLWTQWSEYDDLDESDGFGTALEEDCISAMGGYTIGTDMAE